MTVTFHNGSAAHREHNIRKPSATSKQGHIDPARADRNIVLFDAPPRGAYKLLFGDALAAYNAKQKRPERKIADYFNHIDSNPQKHAVYECIIQIGNRDDHPDYDTEVDVLSRFYRGWANRNPNLYICGAYLHADEEGGTHLHIDYIPFADGYKTGLSRQSALVRAYGQQGFIGTTPKLTAQILWECSERDTLTELCIQQGISVDAPVGGRKHEDTPEFKAKKAALAELDSAIDEQSAELEAATAEQQRLAAEVGDRQVLNLQLQRDNNALEKEIKLKRQIHSQDVSNLAQPVPVLLRPAYGDSVIVKKSDWDAVAEQARNEFIVSAQLKTEKQKRKQVESDRDYWQQNAEPFRAQATELLRENFALKETVSELREERSKFIELIRSILSYLREHAPAIFDVIDRMADLTRPSERQKYAESRQQHHRSGHDEMSL